MGLIKMYARPITYKVNGPGTTETAEGYVATPVRYSTISVEDLADHISADSRVERSKVAVITDSLIKQIREMVLNGHKIEIPHLGSFKPKIKSSMAINPESVDAASFTAKVKFTPSVELKRDLQASRIEKTTLPSAPANPTIDKQKESIIADFRKEAVKALFENDIIAEPNKLEVKFGGYDGGVMILVIQASLTMNDRVYRILKPLKTKTSSGVYEYIDSNSGNVHHGADLEQFEGWEPVDQWDKDIFKCSNFYKVTAGFKAEEL